MTSLEEIISSGRQLPEHHPGAPTREAIRTSLLRTVRDDDGSVAPRRWRLAVGATMVGVAAAAAVSWFNLRGPDDSPLVNDLDSNRAVLAPSANAELEHRRVITPTDDGPSVDEVVRLSNGSVAVAVKRLRPFERFRVIAGDAEVEVRGTAFKAFVEEDRLVQVVVESGLVEVRRWQRSPVLLTAGERWTPSLGKHTSPNEGPDQRKSEVDPTDTTDTTASTDTTALTDTTASTEVGASDVVATTQPAAGDFGSVASPVVASSVEVREPAQASGTRVAVASKAKPDKRLDEDPVRPDHSDSSPIAPFGPERTDASISSSADPGNSAAPPAPPATKAEKAFAAAYRALRGGEYKAAARKFEHVVALDPQGAVASDARYWRAVSLARGKKSGAARSALQRFLRLHSQSARAGSASVMLGWLLVEAGEFESARRLFRVGEKDSRRDVADSARDGLRAIDRKQ